LTSTVRSGIWGLFASISLLLVPVIFAINIRINNASCTTKLTALFLLFFMLHMFFAGMTTEITNLVFLASFFGITLSVFSGDILMSVSENSQLLHLDNRPLEPKV